jgi:hypothetical protein
MDREVIGTVIEPNNYKYAVDAYSIEDGRGNVLTIGQAKEKLAKGETIVYKGIEGELLGTVNLNKKILLSDITRGRNHSKANTLTKLEEGIPNEYLKTMIRNLVPDLEYKYTYMLGAKDNLTYNQYNSKIDEIKIAHREKPRLLEMLKTVACLINIMRPIEQVLEILFNINVPITIYDRDNEVEYDNSKAFFDSINIKDLLINKFKDLPHITVTPENEYDEFMYDEYPRLIAMIARKMRVALLVVNHHKLINPLPDGFQDFGIITDEGKFML